MKESMWGYWLILLGIGIISVMILLQNYTTTNQQDYYLAKEVTYAAMYDAIDYGYYRKNGEVKIIKEKFIENFLRRFAESATLNRNYTINFYTIYEEPPFVSVEIVAKAGEFRFGSESIDSSITTRISALLETKGVTLSEEPTITFDRTYYDFPYGDGNSRMTSSHSLKNDISYNALLNEMKQEVESRNKTWDKSKVKIYKVEYLGMMSGTDDYENYINNMLCPSNNCLENDLNSNIDTLVNGENYVPHSILYKIKNKDGDSALKQYFAKVSEDPTFSYTANNDDLTINWSVNYNCNKKFDESVGIKEYRKKYVTNTEKVLAEGAREEYGIFSNYDYYYGYVDSNDINYPYSNSMIINQYEATPYYKRCLVGIKYKVYYYYDES